jgi:PKD repeat protein
MLTCLAMLAVLFSVFCLVQPGTASAGTPATELTVKLNNTTVKVFTLSELGEMPQITQGYSSIDSMPATCMTAAQGVKITDILTAAGIDVSTVSNLTFKSTDLYSVTLTRQYLLDTNRYFYPNMIPANFDSVSGCPTATALVGGVRVDPILALVSYYQRFGTEPNFNLMDNANSLRLCLGQDPLNPCLITSNKFAKWVNEIDVDGSLLPAAPVAAFSATPTVGTAPLAVQFTDASTGTGTLTYAWDFNNDGTADSTDQNPSYTYNSIGTYSVKLTVTDAYGSSDAEEKTSYIRAITVADFPIQLSGTSTVDLSKADMEALLNTTNTYTDTSGNVFEGVPLRQLIAKVDDGDPATLNTALLNTYNIIFTGLNQDGTNYVQTATAGLWSNYFTGGDIRTDDVFIATKVKLAGTSEFIDLPAISASNPTKLWSPGIVSGNNIAAPPLRVSGLYKIQLTNLPVIVADFTATPTTGTAPLTVSFTDATTGTTPFTYAWDFNNDGTVDSTGQNPSYTYNSIGTYSVKLTVTNAGGSDEELKESYITVSTAPVPVAAFSASQTVGTAPLTVNFTDASTGTAPFTYAWDFNNDGTVDSTGQNPSYTYNSIGTYSVKLTVTDAYGSDTEEKTSYIRVITVADFPIQLSGTSTVDLSKADMEALLNTTNTYTDTSGNVFEGVPLRQLIAMVDDGDPATLNTDLLGTYNIVFTGLNQDGTDYPQTAAAGSWSGYFTGGDIQTDDVFIATKVKLAGTSEFVDLPAISASNPLKNWRPAIVSGNNIALPKYRVSALYKIELNNIPVAPAAAFTASPAAGAAPLTVSFTDASTGTAPLTYAWDFNNDGTVDSTEQNPSYTYDSTGTYSVKLTVTNAAGSDNEVKTDLITAYNPAYADFPIRLNGVSSIDLSKADMEALLNTANTYTDKYGNVFEGVPLQQLIAKVDDGDPATLNTALLGSYNIVFTGLNQNGTDYPQTAAAGSWSSYFTGGDIQTNDVFIATKVKLTGTGDFIDLPAVSASDPTKNWRPAIVSGSNIAAGYCRVSGLYRIDLTGIPAAPVAAFTSTPATGTAPLTVTFTNASTGTALLTFAWDFNSDGTVDSTEQDPSYTYNSVGTYSVKLTVTDVYGRSDDEVKTDCVTVTEQPVVKTPPALAADTTGNTIGQAVTITFADDRTWRAAITGITVEGNSIAGQYSVGRGKITINGGVFSAAGDYIIVVAAAGYSDATVEQPIIAAPIAPPALTADTTENTVGQAADITFSPDATWQAVISGITVNKKTIDAGQYMVTDGNINIAAGVFAKPGKYTVVVKAAGYTNATVIQTIKKQ